MNSPQLSRHPLNGINKTSLSPGEIENSLHTFSDQEWLAIRQQQMDIAPNCIFPVREQRSITGFLHSIRALLVAAVKLPVRI